LGENTNLKIKKSRTNRQRRIACREGIAVFGAPTGQINIYEIAPSDLSIALKLGFKPLPENWNRTDQ